MVAEGVLLDELAEVEVVEGMQGVDAPLPHVHSKELKPLARDWHARVVAHCQVSNDRLAAFSKFGYNIFEDVSS